MAAPYTISRHSLSLSRTPHAATSPQKHKGLPFCRCPWPQHFLGTAPKCTTSPSLLLSMPACNPATLANFTHMPWLQLQQGFQGPLPRPTLHHMWSWYSLVASPAWAWWCGSAGSKSAPQKQPCWGAWEPKLTPTLGQHIMLPTNKTKPPSLMRDALVSGGEAP